MCTKDIGTRIDAQDEVSVVLMLAYLRVLHLIGMLSFACEVGYM